jgi:hypothetical protein
MVGGYAGVVLAFVVFASSNGSLVVGDREAHVVAWHWLQPLYFSVFLVATLCCLVPFTRARHWCDHPTALLASLPNNGRMCKPVSGVESQRISV